MTKLIINTFHAQGKCLKFFKLSVLSVFLIVLNFQRSHAQTYQYYSEISGYTCVPSFVQFKVPTGIVAAKDADYVFVSDMINQSIHQFTQEGKFIRTYKNAPVANPFGITYAAGYLYVANQGSDQILKYDATTGFYETAWGSTGTGNGQFDWPVGVAVDKTGNVYVVDNRNNRIQKFDPSGNFLLTWGAAGANDSEFNNPRGITIDDNGNVYVADLNNYRIQKFNSNGVFITKWGSKGNANGQFNSGESLALDAAGNVYVVDGINNNIQKFNSDGTYISQTGTPGSSNGQLNNARGITISKQDEIFVSEMGNARVQRLTLDGTFITKWGSYGSGGGTMLPAGVLLDDTSHVYVVEVNRVLKFKTDGTFIRQFGEGYINNGIGLTQDTTNGNLYVVSMANNQIVKFDPNGNMLQTFGDTELINPRDVKLDSIGNIYVADGGHSRIVKYDKNGNYLNQLAYSGEIGSPNGLVIRKNKMYVTDIINNSILTFDLNGNLLNGWGTSGSNNSQFNYPFGLDLDSKGQVFVADVYNYRIQQFDGNGIYLNQISGKQPTYFFTPTHISLDKNDNFCVNDINKGKVVFLSKIAMKVVTILGKEIVPTNTITTYNATPYDKDFIYKWEYTGKNLIQLFTDSLRSDIKFLTTDSTTNGDLICKVYTPYGQLYQTIVKPINLRVSPQYYGLKDIHCLPVFNDCSGNYINSFSFGTLRNENSNCSPGAYSDYTGDGRFQTDLVTGSVYHANLDLVSAPDTAGRILVTYVALWIDFNNDGDFEDDYEFLGSAYTSENNVSINNIHIPGTLNYTGQARLRVRTTVNSLFTKSDNCIKDGGIGETEDYLVNIKGPSTLEIPQAITPNNDGLNDLLVIRGINLKASNSLLIVDAMGNKITEISNYNNEWPTPEDVKSLPKGTYYYIFKNGPITLKGFFIVNY